MTVEANTAAILRLAWARTLGLNDDAFDPGILGADEHLRTIDDTAITVVDLFGRQAVLAPAWFLASISDDRVVDEVCPLTEPANLLALAGDQTLRVAADHVITATDAYVDDDALESVPISDDPAAVADLTAACPPDDVSQAALGEATSQFVALDDADLPASAAGYREQSGFLADLTALTVPTHRRRGWGHKAAAIALNDALDGGMIAQLRQPTGSVATAALARGLGLVPVGRYARVELRS